jgi:hypothetical protein
MNILEWHSFAMQVFTLLFTGLALLSVVSYTLDRRSRIKDNGLRPMARRLPRD